MFRTLKFERVLCFFFRLETYRRDVHDAANFNELKHFSSSFSFFYFTSLASSRFCIFIQTFHCPLFPLFSLIRGVRMSSRNVARTTAYFLLHPRFSCTLRKVFALAIWTSVKTSACPTATWSFFDAARRVPMTFLIKLSPVALCRNQISTKALSKLTQIC